MDTVFHLPEYETPATIKEVVHALKDQKLKAVHDKQSWGDWINLQGCETVISIESMRGLTRSATIELSEKDPEEVEMKIVAAFRALGWYGMDEDGEYQL